MTDQERTRLEKAVQICREAGMEGEQLLLIHLSEVEEYLRLEKLIRNMDQIFEALLEIRQMMQEEKAGEEIAGEEEDSGNGNGDPEGDSERGSEDSDGDGREEETEEGSS